MKQQFEIYQILALKWNNKREDKTLKIVTTTIQLQFIIVRICLYELCS